MYSVQSAASVAVVPEASGHGHQSLVERLIYLLRGEGSIHTDISVVAAFGPRVGVEELNIRAKLPIYPGVARQG